MTIQRSPQHGYRTWIEIRCDHCNRVICDGNGEEHADSRAPKEAIMPREYYHGREVFVADFCNQKCLEKYLAEVYGTDDEESPVSTKQVLP